MSIKKQDDAAKVVMEKHSAQRRKLLKKLAAGGGVATVAQSLPETWTRPVVESVLLPVHATTSFGGPFGGTSTNQGLTMIDTDSDSLIARALNSLVSEAQATVTLFDFLYCITPVSETKANTKVLVVALPSNCDFFFADLFTRDGVEINSGPQIMNGPTPQCNGGASAADWFNKLGLIKDAMAGAPTTIELTNIQGQANGTFVYMDNITDPSFTWGGSCPSFDVCDSCTD